MDRGAWWATVHGVTESRTRLSDFTITILIRRGNLKRVLCTEERSCEDTRGQPTTRQEESLQNVTQVYVPRFLVLSQQRFGATDIKALGASQLSGLGQTVL